MIEIKNLKKNYGSLAVLKGVDLTIQRGEVVSIVGASGAGKSTLLQILGTLDRPDAGNILFDSQDIFKLNNAGLNKFRNLKIGFVFQFHNLLPEFTALENVMMPALIGGKSREEAKKRALELMDLLHVAERYHHAPTELSGGEQQRMAVARALMNNPDIILADEPSGNLDSHHAEELHQLFFQLRTSMQQTFVIVTHNEKLASQSDRILKMVDGRIEY
ncbi:MAG: ABC transporter ATP-binding protein [Bacteroidetes bacterium]|nr:ABC transporter ATP-binding protein [Bacteroidota bacterium]